MYAEKDIEDIVRWVNQCFENLPEGRGISLYGVQRDALTSLLKALDNGGRIKGVFQMPTGAGKTVVVAGLIMALYNLGRLKEKDVVLYLTPRIILKEQVEASFTDFFVKNPEFEQSYGLSCFRVEKPESGIIRDIEFFLERWGENEDRILVLIVTPNALYEYIKKVGESDRRINTITNIGRVKAFIMDEVHRVYFGPEISRIIGDFLDNLSESIVLMGVSATPIRQAVERIGELLYSLTSLEAMERGVLIRKLKIYQKRTRTNLINSNKDEWRAAVIDRAEKYSEEILKILSEEARRLYPDDANPLSKRIPKTLIVSVNTVEANDIAERLREKISRLRGSDYRNKLVKVAHYKINEAVEEIEEFRKDGEGILVTVNMADIGFDDKDLEVLVIARPLKTPIAYTQIRGRILRRPGREDENIKAVLGYAVLIDLTGATRHEESVPEVELGELFLEDLNEVEHDLMGEGEVERVRGNVEIEDYGIREIPPQPIETISEEDAKRKILEILRLSHGLTSKCIQRELQERGYKLGVDKIEEVCSRLSDVGVLERRYNTWFYPYKRRILDMMQEDISDKWTIKELIDRAGIPSIHINEVEDIYRKIIREKVDGVGGTLDIYSLSEQLKITPEELIKVSHPDVLERIRSILLIARDGKNMCILQDLDSLLRKKLERNNSWMIIRCPAGFRQRVYNILSNIGLSDEFLVSEEMLDEEWCKIFLRRISLYLAVVNACGRKIPCTMFPEVLDNLNLLIEGGCEEIEILTSSQELAGWVKLIIRAPTHLGFPRLSSFRLEYQYDSKHSRIIIKLIKIQSI